MAEKSFIIMNNCFKKYFCYQALAYFVRNLPKVLSNHFSLFLMGKIQKMVLAELAAIQKKNSSAGNKAKFLSMKEDIEALIVEDGISIHSVWQILFEKKYVSYSYETFNRYCKIYILLPNAETKSSTVAEGKNLAATPRASSEIQVDKVSSEPIIAGGNADSIKGFVFNNNPETKDLF